jgi:hypothetical protein
LGGGEDGFVIVMSGGCWTGRTSYCMERLKRTGHLYYSRSGHVGDEEFAGFLTLDFYVFYIFGWWMLGSEFINC